MKKIPKIAFTENIINLPIKNLKYTKVIETTLLKAKKFQVILSSIKEVGIIESVIVYKKNQEYCIVDGHLRVEALKILDIKTINCIISTDDESFTYNKYVNRVTSIQEHKMIVKAIKRGVLPESIAKALNMEVTALLKKQNLLEGICTEAAEMLKTKMVGLPVFDYLRKMHSIRQIEAVSLMVESNNYSVTFARSLFMASSEEQLLKPTRKTFSIDVNKMANLQNEITKLQNEYKIYNANFGKNMSALDMIQGYIKLLFSNDKIKQYLQKNTPDIFIKFLDFAKLELLEV